MSQQDLMGTTVGKDPSFFEKVYTDIVTSTPRQYSIGKESDDERRFQCFEGTTNMKDGIGNVTDIDKTKGTCSVRAVMRGVDREFRNVRILDPSIDSVNERVMITEHINVNGEIGLVATKSRILKGDCNFFKFGWSNNRRRRTVKVDIYTGEHRVLIEGPAPEGIIVE